MAAVFWDLERLNRPILWTAYQDHRRYVHANMIGPFVTMGTREPTRRFGHSGERWSTFPFSGVTSYAATKESPRKGLKNCIFINKVKVFLFNVGSQWKSMQPGLVWTLLSRRAHGTWSLSSPALQSNSYCWLQYAIRFTQSALKVPVGTWLRPGRVSNPGRRRNDLSC